MASKGYVESYLNRLSADLKMVFVRVFEYVLTTYQLGAPAHKEKATNFNWYRFDSTTAATANEEWSVSHGLNQIPRWVIPVLPLDSSGVQVVRLKVPRPADVNRVYLSSPDTGAAVTVLVEA